MVTISYVLPSYSEFIKHYNPPDPVTEDPIIKDIPFNPNFKPAGLWRLNFGQGDHPNALEYRHTPFELTPDQL